MLQQGAIRLFRVAGIQVYLHWSWFLIAMIEVNNRSREYSSFAWNLLEYVTLFGIVLVHEFGHALACRQVGGKAERIVLWPLGGVAYVSPPPRPGATLWSIAAGPLVNLILAPVLTVLVVLARKGGMMDTLPNAYAYLRTIFYINFGLLIFNLLPIYPLDGGQILRSLLWFIVGRARSLMVTTIIGFVGVAGLIALAAYARDIWLGVIAGFILINCWGGLQHARLLARASRLPRRTGFACPVCHEPPILGPLWRCARCLKPFDTFEARAHCPHCGTEFPTTMCFECGSTRPFPEWIAPPPLPPNL
jgi:Zn-dependent protease